MFGIDDHRPGSLTEVHKKIRQPLTDLENELPVESNPDTPAVPADSKTEQDPKDPTPAADLTKKEEAKP